MFHDGAWSYLCWHQKSGMQANSRGLSSAAGLRLGIHDFSEPFLNPFAFLGLSHSWRVTSSTCWPPAAWRSTSLSYYFKRLLPSLKCSPTLTPSQPVVVSRMQSLSGSQPQPAHLCCCGGALDGHVNSTTARGSLGLLSGCKWCLRAGMKIGMWLFPQMPWWLEKAKQRLLLRNFCLSCEYVLLKTFTS